MSKFNFTMMAFKVPT